MALISICDEREDLATLVDTTTNWSIGPVFDGPDAEEQADAFLRWFSSGDAAVTALELGLRQQPLSGGGRDPRDWFPNDLEKLVEAWRARRAVAA